MLMRRDPTGDGVPFRGTVSLAAGAGSEAPASGLLGRRAVGAEDPCLDARGEVTPELRVSFLDLPERQLDALGHGEAGTLGRRGRMAIAAAETDRRRELARQELDLFAGAIGAADVVELISLGELIAQLGETAL